MRCPPQGGYYIGPTKGDPMSSENSRVTRRDFVKTTAAAATAAMIVPRHVLGRGFQAPSDLVNIIEANIRIIPKFKEYFILLTSVGW